jgi:hypothetical protein
MNMIGGIDPNDGTTLTDAVTACQTALATLQRLGASDLADGPLADAEQSSTYAALDADTDHSQPWLTSAYARRYSSVMAALASRLTAAANTAGKQDATDASNVFGVAGLPGDAASLAISRRDAADRVADVTDPTQRQALLASAVRNGDNTLARALVQAAVESGDLDTVNAFTEAFPELNDAVERLWIAQHRKSTAVDLTAAFRLAALKPVALGAMQNFEIQAAAAGQTTPGAPTLRG